MTALTVTWISRSLLVLGALENAAKYAGTTVSGWLPAGGDLA